LLTKTLAEAEFEKTKKRIIGKHRGDVSTNLEGSVRKTGRYIRAEEVTVFRKQESVSSVPKTRENSARQ